MDAYVPIYSDGDNVWYPSNDAAVTLVKLIHAWKDIVKLNEVRLVARKGDNVADKLLLKYTLIESFSALDHARNLQGIVRKAPRLVLGKDAPPRYITKRNLEMVNEVYKGLWRELAPLEPVIAKIRNKIGAHRSAELGSEINDLWNELDADKFVSLINRIPALIDVVKNVNIFDWSWVDASLTRGSVFGCRIVHDWKDAFTGDEVE